MLADDCETITGIRPKTPFNEKGHEILFITPSGDVFADPGIYTFMGYLMLFHELDLDYTFSTYASEGGNFGSFTTFNMAKKLNAKMYAPGSLYKNKDVSAPSGSWVANAATCGASSTSTWPPTTARPRPA